MRTLGLLPTFPVVVTLLSPLAGCDSGVPAATDPLDPRACSALVKEVPNEGATHLPEGTSVSYAANPPASGSHWPIWSPWGAFLDTVVPRERWVHNLEHGGIVLLFNCPGLPSSDMAGDTTDGGMQSTAPCPEITQALVALRNERKPDKFGVIRVLVTGDPRLPARVGAVAWNWSMVSDTVDAAALRCFIDKRYGQGPEDAP